MSDAYRQATWFSSASTAAWAVAAGALVFLLRLGVAVRFAPRILLVPGVCFGAGALLIVQTLVTQGPLLMWYVLPVVLGWVLVLGCDPGLTDEAVRPGTRWLLRALGLVAPAVCVVIWTGNSLAMAALPRQPMREAVLAAHEPAMAPWFVRLCTGFQLPKPETAGVPSAPSGPPPEGRLVGVAGTSELQMRLYDPTATPLRLVTDLDELESRAAAEGKAVYVSVCGWESSHVRNPDLMRRLEADSYETVTDLPGWEPMFSYRVLRKRR